MMPFDPGKDGLAHEMGHYLHLGHTFNTEYATVADAQAGIRTYVESNGLSKTRGYDLFDGDNLASTPPDPGPQLFSSAGLDPCNASQGTLSIPVTFSDKSIFTYQLTPDREDIMDYWDKWCRGKSPDISSDQVNAVRGAIDTGNRSGLTSLRQEYSAVFETGSAGETRAISWAFNDMVSRFDQEIAAGKHLVHMQAYDIGNSQIRYDGVWDNGARGTTRAFAWSLTDFASRFNQEIASGKHIAHMQAYDIGGGQIRFDGVWEDGARGTTRAIAWSLTDFASRFNQEIASGKHLAHMQAYDIGGGQIRYDGVWEDGARGTTRAIAWSQGDFINRYNQELASGQHLVHMQAYDIGGGQIRYDGVWKSGSQADSSIVGSVFNDFVARNEAMLALGKRLIHFQSYDIGNGQLRYDGVWQTSTLTQTHIFAETLLGFATQFNQQISAGKHAVLMQSVTGR